jgi:hypothetical protein
MGDLRTRALDLIAKESQLEVADVAKLYTAELTRLTSGARIARFLPIFALRNVRESLARRVPLRPELGGECFPQR